MKMLNFLNKIKFHQITTVTMVSFNPNSTSKLRSDPHLRYPMVIEACLIYDLFIKKNPAQSS